MYGIVVRNNILKRVSVSGMRERRVEGRGEGRFEWENGVGEEAIEKVG